LQSGLNPRDFTSKTRRALQACDKGTKEPKCNEWVKTARMQHGTMVNEDSAAPNDEWEPMREFERSEKNRQAQGKGAERDIPRADRREFGTQLQAEGYPIATNERRESGAE